MQKLLCLGVVSCQRVCCRRRWDRPCGEPGALRDVRGGAWGYHCAIGRAERRGGCVVMYGSYEEGECFKRVATLW
jgi:hypothetical protein